MVLVAFHTLQGNFKVTGGGGGGGGGEIFITFPKLPTYGGIIVLNSQEILDRRSP